MKRSVTLLVVVALGLTACTDQPTPAPPSPSVTETGSPAPSDTPVTEAQVAQHIANVLEHPAPETFPTNNAALTAFSNVLLGYDEDEDPDDDAQSCAALLATEPQVAVFGSAPPAEEANSDNTESEESSGLAAFSFASSEEALVFTEQLLDFVEQCDAAHYETDQLTHHTEAVEITAEFSADHASSIVLLRNQHWVLAATSSPPADVALNLTLVDQLDEMLR